MQQLDDIKTHRPKDDLPDDWVTGPITRCIEFIADEFFIVGFLTQSITACEYQGRLLKIAKQQNTQPDPKNPLTGIEKAVRFAPEQALWADKQKQADFSDLHKHSIFTIWRALEDCIENTVVLILVNDPGCHEPLSKFGIDIKKRCENGISENQAHRIYAAIKRRFSVGRNAGEALTKMLESFGIKVLIDYKTLCTLDEMNEVSRCIIHKAGVIDDRAAGNIPSLEKHAGVEFFIDRNTFLEYFEGIKNFSLAVLKGVAESKYMG